MSCIYYIKHKETGKMYIGQTVQPLEQRMRQHLVGSIEIDKLIKQLGIDAFEYGVLEQCNSEELDEKEIYYIAKYDTYYNGYNNQLGGRKTGKNKYDNIIESIRQDYINGMSMIDLNIKYRIRNESIRYFVQDLNRHKDKVYTFESKSIICYTVNWKRIEVFESIKEALKLVNNQRQKDGKPEVDERNFYRTIKTACTKNGISSRYRWQYREDVIYDEKEFNSSIDKKNYISGLKCECINNIWYTVKIENSIKTTEKSNKIREDLIIELYKHKTNEELADIFSCSPASVRMYLKRRGLKAKSNLDENSVCSICDRLGVYKDGLCVSCYNVKIKGKTPKPSKEQLVEDMKTLSIKEIAEKYNRTSSTVCYWINDYEIKQAKTNDTSKKLVYCIELNQTFNTLIEAARLVYKSDSHGTSYRIGQAAKLNKDYKGYHWKLIDKQ